MTEYECENEDCMFRTEQDPWQPPPGICPSCGSPMRKVDFRLISKKMLDKLKRIVREKAGRY